MPDTTAETQPSAYTPTDRTVPTRDAERASYDREVVHAILDEGYVRHLGFVRDGAPVVLPTLYGRVGERLYIHGSTLLLAGEADAAREAFSDGAGHANAASILCDAELALLAVAAGDWPTATRHAGAAVGALEANHMHGYATAALGYAVAARVATGGCVVVGSGVVIGVMRRRSVAVPPPPAARDRDHTGCRSSVPRNARRARSADPDA